MAVEVETSLMTPATGHGYLLLPIFFPGSFRFASESTLERLVQVCK